MRPQFRPGRNIAMKVPVHEHEATVGFYRDVLGLREVDLEDTSEHTPRFHFGDKCLWIDRVSGLSQAEVWLEIVTDDIDAAARHLEAHGCARRDEIEPLPDGPRAFWIASPCDIIHLVNATGSA